jgi:hypothetical protein
MTNKALEALEDDIKLLENFVSDRSKFGGETIDSAIKNVCTALSRPWRPIETAPKDGTWVVCVEDDGTKHVAQFNKTWVTEEYDYTSYFIDPTHWMPLPPPPQADNAERGE